MNIQTLNGIWADLQQQLEMEGFVEVLRDGDVYIDAEGEDEYVEFTIRDKDRTAKTDSLEFALDIFNLMVAQQ